MFFLVGGDECVGRVVQLHLEPLQQSKSIDCDVRRALLVQTDGEAAGQKQRYMHLVTVG